MASPAPTVLPCASRVGRATRAPWRSTNSAPSVPIEIATSATPRSTSAWPAARRAPQSGSGVPVQASSSWRLGLIAWGSGRCAPLKAAASASPLVSSSTRAPPALACASNRAHASAGSPEGRLPDSTTGRSGCSRAASRRDTASRSASPSVRPGRLMSVVSPLASSTSLMLVRVRPGMRRQPSAMRRAENSALNTPSLPSPSTPSAVVCTPQSARQAATLMPLPPASSRVLRARCTWPGCRRANRTVWSIAGFRVMVTACALMRALHPGRAPAARFRSPARCRPAPADQPVCCRAGVLSRPGCRSGSSTVRPRPGRPAASRQRDHRPGRRRRRQ